MTIIDPDDTLADLVTRNPALAEPLGQLGLDYCCGGRQTLARAASEAGLDLADTLAVLSNADSQSTGRPSSEADWSAMTAAELVDHLESTHHAYLRRVLPQLGELAVKVARVHGANHPELVRVADVFMALRSDLEPHLMKEERVLFPLIRDLQTATTSPDFHCGSLVNPIRVMLMEHDTAGELLAQLRSLTDGFTCPADACGSYTALYSGLAELEADTHMHVHKENNLLFPKVLEAEAALR